MISASAIRFIGVLLVAGAVFLAGRVALAAEVSPPLTVEIADVGRSGELAKVLTAKGYQAVIPPKNIWVVDPQSNCTVWIGKNVPLEMLRSVLSEAIRFNPYLKFFYLVGDRGEQPPAKVDNTIHVGGSVEAALTRKLNPIDPKAMLETLERAKDLAEVHQFLHEKNLPKPSVTEKPAS